MTADVQPLLTPDPEAMREHIDHVFGGFLDGHHDGLVELAWTDPVSDEGGRYPLRHAQSFELDDDSIDRLIARAVELSSQPRTNVYVGACLRKPGTTPFGRCEDGDFYAASCAYADLDDKDANDQAKFRFAKAPPTFVVRTGDFPHWRNQVWWRYSETVTDPERQRAIINGIAGKLAGDGTISNPSRVMRLAGTIAWDQKPGRRPEMTRIVRLKVNAPSAYVPEHVESVYPPLVSLEHARTAASRQKPGPNNGIVRAAGSLGLTTGKVIDGREKHMTAVLCARLIDYCGQFGAAPDADELFEHAWEIYERSTDLARAGRNKPEFMDKCRSTLRRFEQGKIRGAETLEKAVVSYQTRKDAKRDFIRNEAAPETSQAPQNGVFEYLDIAAIKALPDARWAVRDIIIEDALGFIYGPPGHGKTFVALSLALSVAYSLPSWWWGKAIQRPGLVVYVAREGVAGLKDRITAWQRANKIDADDGKFILIRAGINFLAEESVNMLAATIAAAAAQMCAEPALIFVDTVSRVLPGADENLQKEMTIFVAACDHLRDKFRATVVGVHHAGKSGDMRGSTVLKGAGDFVFKIERSDADDKKSPVVFEAEKIKDAEDGWSKLIELAPCEWFEEGKIDGERKSLVARPAEDSPAQNAPSMPDWETCKRILAMIREAWAQGHPWSNSPQSKSEGRYAPEKMFRQFGVKAAAWLVNEWLNNDVLAVEIFNRRSGAKGLKVIGKID